MGTGTPLSAGASCRDVPLLTSFELVFVQSIRGKAENHPHTWFCK